MIRQTISSSSDLMQYTGKYR